MNVLIAIDSFKGSMTSLEAAGAIEEGIIRACLGVNTAADIDANIDANKDTDIDASIIANVAISPVADGGEGTLRALTEGMYGELRTSVVSDPLCGKVTAEWGIIETETAEKIAIIEMASAAGLSLLKPTELNPLNTTTYGVGELIRAAIDEGCRKFIVGIGGSATNDGGVGMLMALGYEFLDEDGNRIELGAKGLKNLAAISSDRVIPELKECTFRIACDVVNPLCGENGCSAVFGPQKGATPEMISDMDGWLSRFAEISKGDADYPGCGAAGGMGYAFLTFTNATLERGIDIVLEETGLSGKIAKADIVVTGEGKIDSQTVMGKAPIGVAKLAKKFGKTVIAFCGSVSEDGYICNEHGIDAIFPIVRGPVNLEEALDKNNAVRNLTDTAEQVFRIICEKNCPHG